MTRPTLRKLSIDWDDLRDALDRPWSWRHHDLLDVETGEVLLIHDSVMRHVEQGEPEGQRMGPWQLEDVPLARKILADRSERYVPIPRPEKEDRFEAMLNFTRHPELLKPTGSGFWTP